MWSKQKIRKICSKCCAWLPLGPFDWSPLSTSSNSLWSRTSPTSTFTHAQSHTHTHYKRTQRKEKRLSEKKNFFKKEKKGVKSHFLTSLRPSLEENKQYRTRVLKSRLNDKKKKKPRDIELKKSAESRGRFLFIHGWKMGVWKREQLPGQVRLGPFTEMILDREINAHFQDWVNRISLERLLKKSIEGPLPGVWQQETET